MRKRRSYDAMYVPLAPYKGLAMVVLAETKRRYATLIVATKESR